MGSAALLASEQTGWLGSRLAITRPKLVVRHLLQVNVFAGLHASYCLQCFKLATLRLQVQWLSSPRRPSTLETPPGTLFQLAEPGVLYPSTQNVCTLRTFLSLLNLGCLQIIFCFGPPQEQCTVSTMIRDTLSQAQQAQAGKNKQICSLSLSLQDTTPLLVLDLSAVLDPLPKWPVGWSGCGKVYPLSGCVHAHPCRALMQVILDSS